MLAVPVFRSRVAPVLNWCTRILIISGDETSSDFAREIALPEMNCFKRLQALRDMGVNTLICGALSPDLLRFGQTLGLVIIPGVAGQIEEVLTAYYARTLDRPEFWLPGCRGRRQYRSERCCSENEPPARQEIPESEQVDAGGTGKRENLKKRRRTGSEGGGPGGFCVCPQCGETYPHERGIPCAQSLCPHCHCPLDRQ